MEEYGIRVNNIYPGFVQSNVDLNSIRRNGKLEAKKDKNIENGMTDLRFSQLCLCAVSGNVREAWIAKQPVLGYSYLMHHASGLIAHHLRRYLGKQLLKDNGY